MPKAAQKRPSPRPREEVKSLCDSYGIEQVCSRMIDGFGYRAIAREIGVETSVLWRWVQSDEERRARAREAMSVSAKTYDEEALQRIEMAADVFELSKAKEIANHLRWRAKALDPDVYGERAKLDHTGNVNMTLFDGEQARRMAQQISEDHSG